MYRKPSIGVSACLVGEPVRYDGTDRTDRVVTGPLAEVFRLTPVCPETAIGLPTPRPPIELRRQGEAPQAIYRDTESRDVTSLLEAEAAKWWGAAGPMVGMVAKSKSPSCALKSSSSSEGEMDEPGIFTAALARLDRWLPIVESEALATPEGADCFVELCLGYTLLRRADQGPPGDVAPLHPFLTLGWRHFRPEEERALIKAAQRGVDAYCDWYMTAVQEKEMRVEERVTGLMTHSPGREADERWRQLIRRYEAGETAAPLFELAYLSGAPIG